MRSTLNWSGTQSGARNGCRKWRYSNSECMGSPRVSLSTPTASTYSLPSGGFPIPEVSKSLKPTIDSWDWQLNGACRGLPAEMFFYPDGERGRHRDTREAKAKAVCATCSVIVECRAHALAVPEIYGIWGGLGEEERANLIRKRLRLVI